MDGRSTIEELEEELRAAEAELASVRPSDEQLRAEAAEVEANAARNGIHAKTSAIVYTMQRRWLAFLEKHGEAYGYDADEGPTVELAKHFQVCQEWWVVGG